MDSPTEDQRGVRIPTDQLSPAALRAVIEEFVTRDGTETTEAEKSIEQVTALLARGEVELWFDETTRTCNILPAGRDQ